MTIDFYLYEGPHNRIHKSPSPFLIGTIPTQTILSIQGDFKSDFDLKGGELYVNYGGMLSGQSTDTKETFMKLVNYLHIYDNSNTFSRWYYITEKTMGENGMMKLTLDCDLLYTYSSQLDWCEILVDSSSISTEDDINDGTLVRKETQFNIVNEFSGGLSGSTFILITAGPQQIS